MDNITLPSGMNAGAAKKFAPFASDILKWPRSADGIDSIYVYGSALTDDYSENISDINSLIVLNAMDFDFLRHTASLGKTYKKSNIAPPLIMTESYINSSLDVFPDELLNMRINHACVRGRDVIAAPTIEKEFLRLQCERELKTMLVNLRQGFISAGGNAEGLATIMHKSINGLIAVFRAVVFLKNEEPRLRKRDAVEDVERVMGISNGGRAFMRVLDLRSAKGAPPKDEAQELFERYYNEVYHISMGIDELTY